MTIFISGSIAIDTVMSCPAPFLLDAEQVSKQRLTASYYVSNMQHVWGGCAANIAYAARQLGATPIVMATVGSDAGEYLKYFQQQGISIEYIKSIPHYLTAKATIFSDSLGQQITGFYAGAMNEAHVQKADIALTKYQPTWAIVSPDGKQAMINRSIELAQAKVPFIADPGQATPIMDKNELLILMQGASVIAINEAEAVILEHTLKQNAQELSHKTPVVITLGDKGLCFWDKGLAHTLEAVKDIAAVDATGCGDSLRGAWLYALSRGWSMFDGLRLGNLMGAYKVQRAGAQGYVVSLNDLQMLWHKHYDVPMPQ
ncbi:MAG: hypothetical protein RI956_550 [Pseudomonadota bacterium]|jgi:adenosine kinase